MRGTGRDFTAVFLFPQLLQRAEPFPRGGTSFQNHGLEPRPGRVNDLLLGCYDESGLYELTTCFFSDGRRD